MLFLAGLRATHSRWRNISSVSGAATSGKSDVTAVFQVAALNSACVPLSDAAA